MTKKVEIEQTKIEAPYELPDGWKWVKIGDIAEIINGKNQKDVEDENGVYPIYGSGGIIGKARNFICPENCTIIGRKGTINNPIFVETKFWNVDTAFGMKTFDCVNPKFYFYFCKSYNFTTLDSSTAIPSLTKTNIQQIPFPLPPTLAQQQRIVNRIETMFSKLDQAQEKAQAVLDSFETRKAAILHKAFSGELTANWRKENGVSDDSWEEKTVGDCCVEVKVGIVIKPTRYYTEAEKGIPAFRSANVRENHIDDFDWVYINDEGMKNEQRSIVHTNDVLVVRSGAPGTACVVTDQFDGYNAIDILIAVPTQDIINSYFLCYYTNSPMGKNIVAEKKRGLGLTHFNVKGYSATPIKVPTLPEQQEIVRILDTVLEKELRAKDATQTVLGQIALLKKSILARAFRGEL